MLGISPFSQEISRLNEAQLDWVLERYAADEPDKATFSRGAPKASQPEINAAWERVFIGKAHSSFMERFGGKKVMDQVRAWQKKHAMSLDFLKSKR